MLKRKLKTLLIPYCSFAIISIGYYKMLALVSGGNFSVLKALASYLIQCRYTPLWYIAALFIAEIIIWFVGCICKENGCRWGIASIIFFVLFFSYLEFIGLALPWNADLSLLAVAFMSLGKCCRIFDVFGVAIRRFNWAAILISATIAFAFSWLNFHLYGPTDWYGSSFGNCIIFAVAASFGVMMVVLVSMKIHSRILSEIGRNSITYYALNRLVIDFLFIVASKIGLDAADFGVIYALPIVAVSVIVLAIFNSLLLKTCPFVLGRKQVIK